MKKQLKANRALLLIFVLTCALSALHHFDVLGHVSYAFERGRLRADLDHLQQIDASEVVALEQVSHAFSVIAQAVKPSVVNIAAVSSNDALNRKLEEMFGENRFQPIPKTGTGSGVILDDDGHIVTNNHVVEDAESIHVTLHDGRRYRAQVVGTDPMTDIAVIKIKAEKLHPARLGDSDRMKVGHLVLAIGSPFRFGHSVSHGIISAIGRSDVEVNIDYQNWIQTDAPINPGNSGGPLINARGEVIGITTAIATESGGHQGVGFAIPSNKIARVAAGLKTGRKIVRGFLGVGIKPVDPQVAGAYGLKAAGGVLIDAVGRKTPAARAGLKSEDIILEVDGVAMHTREDLQELIAETQPGNPLDLTVWRNRETIKLTVTVGVQETGFSTTGSLRDLDRWHKSRERDSDAEGNSRKKPRPPNKSENPVRFDPLGFQATTVSPELARRYKLDDRVENGALVLEVDPTGEAYAAGLRTGYVVIRAGGRRVRNARQLEQVLTQEAIAKGVSVRVQKGKTSFLTVLQIR